MKVRETIYRLGNKEERELYKKGIFPTLSSNRTPYFSNDLDSVFQYKVATQRGETHSKNNKMDYLYSMAVEYDPKKTIKICTHKKGKTCKAFFFKGVTPKIIFFHSQRVS